MQIDFAMLRENAGAGVRTLLSHIDPDDDRDSLVSNVRELCRCFVNIAAATLLVEGRPQPFFLNLCRAAENWRRLLVHLEQRALRPPPASWGLVPLAGAMTAGHWELAAQVAERMTRECQQQDEEYPVEHAWASTMAGLTLHIRRGEDPSRRIQELERFSRDTCWAELAKALVARDSTRFQEAFAGALTSHGVRTEKLARGFTQREDHFAAHRYLWFDGLALLQLAMQHGLDEPAIDLRYCPPLARVPMTERYTGDWVCRLGLPSSPSPR